MAKRKASGANGAAVKAAKRRSADVRVGAIETGELRLTDSSGRVRAVLEMSKVGPCLVMMHEDGTVALEIVLGKDGPSLRLGDERGDTRVFLGAKRGTGRLGMADGDGSQRLFAGVDSRGKPSLALYDGEQRKMWTTGSKHES